MFYPRAAVSQGKHWFWGQGSLILLPLPQLSKSSRLQEVQTPLLWGPPLLQGRGLPPAANNKEQTLLKKELRHSSLFYQVFFSI